MTQVIPWHDGPFWYDPLKRLVDLLRQRDPNSRLSVGTGWSSAKTLFDHHAAWPLRDFARAQLPPGTWELSGWANVMRKGDVVAAHDHTRSHLGGENQWAGVYYLDAPAGSGALIVRDAVIQAVPSTLVIFEADAAHWVEPHGSDEPRISIAFNARAIG